MATKGYGFTADMIDMSSPADLEPYSKAYKLQLQQQDSQLHVMGMYVLSAVSTAIEHNFAGKKAKSEYIKEPLLSKAFENDGLTEEEIQEKEIRKAILTEQRYMAMAINKGLPETIIL
ncbi:MAG: hypothetical protein NC548_62945 [Lachnospiraceae bacterium]|nr:hypothetical protein [Lachnospiraceae bacterium]